MGFIFWFSSMRELTNEQSGKVDELLQRTKATSTLAHVDRGEATRFLIQTKWEVDQAFALLKADMEWKQNMDLANLTVAHVQERLRAGLFQFPETRAEDGRTIVVFNAHVHDPNIDCLETMKAALYLFKVTIEGLDEGVEDFILIDNLDGFTKANADARMIKYLVELLQVHFPERLGKVYAVSAPWYYRVFFKIVKPWLSSDLLDKVSIYSDNAKIMEVYGPDRLTKELGGNVEFDMDAWMKKRAEIEGVDLNNPPPLNMGAPILAAFGDFPTEQLLPHAKKSGWMKKQGGFVRKFNKRFCILTDMMFYYYLEENAKKPEGFVELMGASLSRPKDKVFHITTSVHKVCVFSVDAEHYQEWTDLIESTIQALNKEAARH